MLVLALVAGALVALALRPGAAPATGGAGTRAVLLSGSSLSYAGAREAAAALSWDMTTYALPAAGFSRSNLDPASSITATARRLFPADGPPPDVVVLQGGEADNAATPAAVETAVAHLLDYVRAHTGPRTRIVLVGPIPAGAAPASLVRISEQMSRAARTRDVAYIDALGQGWTSRDPTMPGLLAAQLATVVPVTPQD